MKVFIAIPCLDFLPAAAAFPLMALLARRAYDSKLRKEVEIVAIQPCQGTIIPDSRRSLVETALASSATHLWFIDSDIVVSEQVLNRLISHHQPIVGASYKKRYPPHEMLGAQDPNAAARGPLVPMQTMPLGCCLIKLAIFTDLPRPWFAYEFGAATGNVRDISEDSWFCRQVRGAGHTIWCDTTISVGHVSTQVVR